MRQPTECWLDRIHTDDAAGVREAYDLLFTHEKRFDVESVDYPTPKDIKITRDGKAWVVQAAYDDQAPLFSNLAILVVFDKTVRIGGGGTE